ncbi:zinc finger protein 16-like [Topomyia yanbarensis]|uniref:zinc finger protein 16-like n=1 Tax=Topomyia yanbarensis TaxID=2498891 RepID=UPI00273AAA99|nr:zinc finger protein 16-like [Topomyia yanbarensis]
MDIRCRLCRQPATNSLIAISCTVYPQDKNVSEILEILDATLGPSCGTNSSNHVCVHCLGQIHRIYLLFERSKQSHMQPKCAEGKEQNYFRCRLCKREDTEELIEMTCLSDRWNVQIDQLLLLLTGVCRKNRDGLPPYVCNNCLVDLEEGYGCKNQWNDAALKAWQKMEFQSENPTDLIVDLYAEIIPLWLIREEDDKFEKIRIEKYLCSVCNLEFKLEQVNPQCVGCMLNFSNHSEIASLLLQRQSKRSDEVVPNETIGVADSIIDNNIETDPDEGDDSDDFVVKQHSKKSDEVPRETLEVLDSIISNNTESESDDDDDDGSDDFFLQQQSKKSDKEVPSEILVDNIVGNDSDEDDSAGFKMPRQWKLSDVTGLFDVFEISGSIYQNAQRKGPICCGCNSIFLTEADIEEHRRKEHSQPSGSGEFTCKLCLKSFPTDSSFSAHRNKLKKDIYESCEQCQLIFLTEIEFMRHEIKFHIDKSALMIASGKYKRVATIVYECCVPACRNGYANQQQLIDHYNLVHKQTATVNEKDTTCQYCGLSFPNERDFLEHTDRKVDRKQYQCIIYNCKFTADRLSCIVRHCTERGHKKSITCFRWQKYVPDFKHFNVIGNIDESTDILQRKSEVCCGCSTFFELEEDLNRHYKEKHLPIEDGCKYRCSACRKGFRTKLGLSLHAFVASIRTHYYCRPCRTFLWRKTDLINHKSHTHTDEQRVEVEEHYDTTFEDCFTCCGCEKQFQQQEELAQHRISEHSRRGKRKTPQSVRCDLCNKFLTNAEILVQHKTMYESRKIYLCKTQSCAFRTRKLPAIVRHVSSMNHYTADGKKIFVISDNQVEYFCCMKHCDFVSNSYDSVIEHGSKSHAERREYNANFYRKENVSCPVCMKGFRRSTSLVNHQSYKRRQNPNKKVDIAPRSKTVCTICGKYLSATGMLNHMLMHENKRAWKCSLCPLRFNTETMLRNHYRVHSGDKLFKCRHGCDNRYKGPGDRTRHEKLVHLGIKPFSCLTCSDSFVRKRDLQLHERKHTGRKLYPCDFCGDGFDKLSEFKLHKDKCSQHVS